jgi:colanic acid/amylovoran biosynthesis protein
VIFYLAGQTSFGNRGCEALVRGTVDILRHVHGDAATFLVPSVAPAEDAAQWAGHQTLGVRFVQAPTMPAALKNWCSVVQRIPGLAGLEPPTPRQASGVEADLQQADAVLMIGGDIVSLDYGVHSLYFWTKLIDRARQLGKPTYLWAASVGPFEGNRHVVKAMGRHLAGYVGISVRESTSHNYLQEAFGVRAVQVGDPAFRLAVAPPRAELQVDVQRLQASVAINVSPLVRDIAGGGGRGLEAELIQFARWLVAERGCSITLLYHVDQLEKPDNSDLAYLRGLQAKLGLGERCYCVPEGLNACELKWVISQLNMLVAARTHATIAAFSQAVPAISIGYSRKARALNLDLFGSDRYVIDAQRLTSESLQHLYDELATNRDSVVASLGQKAGELRQSALKSANILQGAPHA